MKDRLLTPSDTADIIRKYNIRSEMDTVPLTAEIKEAQDTKSVKARDKEWIEWLEQFSLIDPTDATKYKSFRMNWDEWKP